MGGFKYFEQRRSQSDKVYVGTASQRHNVTTSQRQGWYFKTSRGTPLYWSHSARQFWRYKGTRPC